MYKRVQRNGKLSPNSSTNQFAPRPFKVEESLPPGNLSEGDVIQNQELAPKPSNIDSKSLLSRISITRPDGAQPLPPPGIQMKLGIGEANQNYQPEYQPLPSAPRLQMKLTIGQPGDKYEQEADRTAKDVVQRIHSTDNQVVQNKEQPTESIGQEQNFWLSRMSIQQPPYQSDTSIPSLQMKLNIPQPGEEHEPTLKLQRETPVQPLIQRVNNGGMAASPDVEAGIQRARSGGLPLADNIREPMEQAFGADFSGVRVHTDSQADQLNQSIQAKAFTTGRDVFFRQGAYEPTSRGGQELLAHELTHVVQQNGGALQQCYAENLQPLSLRVNKVIQRRVENEDLINKVKKFVQKWVEQKYAEYWFIDLGITDTLLGLIIKIQHHIVMNWNDRDVTKSNINIYMEEVASNYHPQTRQKNNQTVDNPQIPKPIEKLTINENEWVYEGVKFCLFSKPGGRNEQLGHSFNRHYAEYKASNPTQQLRNIFTPGVKQFTEEEYTLAAREAIYYAYKSGKQENKEAIGGNRVWNVMWNVLPTGVVAVQHIHLENYQN